MAGSGLHLPPLAPSYLHGSPYGTVSLVLVVPGEPALIGQDQVLWKYLKPFGKGTQFCPMRLRAGKSSPKGKRVFPKDGESIAGTHCGWCQVAVHTLVHTWPQILVPHVCFCLQGNHEPLQEVATLTSRLYSISSHPLHPPKKGLADLVY